MNEVRRQYEKWIYPIPVQDLDADRQAGTFDLSDPSLFRRKLWPRRVEPDNLKILIAGCGTTQAARVAFFNPGCTVVGVDLSQASLDHELFLKNKHGLTNLELRCCSLLDVHSLGQQFDLIISTGVLHHLPDPDAGLPALKDVLLPHGVISIMVYGWYRRFGVYRMQDVFRMLGVEQTDDGVALVRETLGALPAWHHVKSYLGTAQDLAYDAGLVDTFLHPCDRAYSVPQVLKLAAANGLRFRDWLDRQWYSLSALVPPELLMHAPALSLPREQQWQLVELLSQALGSHRFLLCHPERNPEEYTLDFTGDNDRATWLGYIPHQRPAITVWSAAGASGALASYRRDSHEFTLAGLEAQLFAQVDGQATIADIIQKCSASTADRAPTRVIARKLFARMHDWDHLLYAI